MAVFNEIRSYFERNKDLHVLFVFDQMESMQTELSDPALALWEEYPDYKYVVFDGGWINVKYMVTMTKVSTSVINADFNCIR